MAATKWNSADKGSNILLGDHGILQTSVGAPATYHMVRATNVVNAGGGFSFDITALRNETVVGFAAAAATTTNYVGSTADGWGFLISGFVYNNNAIVQSGLGQVQTYDKVTSVYDKAAGEIYWYVNDSLIYTATSVTGDLYPAISHRNGGIACTRFLGYAATITFASGAITDASGSSVTESGVIASVCDRATGVQIATTTANISGGAATLAFTADVVNGQAVVVHFHNASGTFKSLGLLNTVVV